jgi:hypothetical protein
MPRRGWLAMFFAAFVSTAHAQTSDMSVHALCDAHADALLTALDQSHYDTAAADFNDALRARYSAEKLQHDYESLPSKYGKMLGRGRPHVGDMAGHTVVMTPLIFEHGTLSAEVHCDADGAVSDVRLEPTQVMGTP